MKKFVTIASHLSRRGLYLSLLIMALIMIAAVVYFPNGSPVNASGDETDSLYRKKLSQENSPNSKEAIAQIESEPLADPNTIYLNAGKIDVTSEEALAMRREVTEFQGKQMRLVKFADAIKPEWYKSLLATGVEVVDYIPNNAYLVYGDFAAMSKLQSQALKSGSAIVWDAEYIAAQRIDPNVKPRFLRAALVGQVLYFNIQLQKDEKTNSETLALIGSRQLAATKDSAEYLHYVTVTAALSEDAVNEIAQRPDVISIQNYFEPVKLDERQNLIVSGNIAGNLPNATNYYSWLASKGFSQSQFTSSNFTVDVTDSGIDNGTTAPNHFGLYTSGDVTQSSRVVYNRLEGTPNGGSTIQGCDGHGNLNSHIVGGFVPEGSPFDAFPYADASGYRYGLGVAPFVKVGSSVIFDPNVYTTPDLEDLQSRAYNNNARISSNSWGASTSSYTTDAQRYDALVRDAQPTGAAIPVVGNQEMVIVFAAGNSGSSSGTVGSPGTGKNVITVGASENVQAFGAADQCGVADSGADSLNDIISFSSRGPTSDGRKKPEIVAPGTHITGGVAQTPGQLSTTPAAPNGSANACFNAAGVCAGPGTSDYFPVGQQWYTASSGTSHSTPAVSGGAALIRQHFINLTLPPPSPAMTKAVLTNGARYMTGVGANDNLFSNNQGMGLMDLNATLDGITNAVLLRDQEPADKFTATSQTRVFNVNATAGTMMRVTLVWTDAPGSTTGSSVKNNLNLTVANGANTYLGNVFSGRASVTGGTADALNNTESVFLPETTGTVTITVTAANINSDGVPGDADVLDQDFALIVTKIDSSAFSNVVGNGVTLTSESYLPANSAPDPGELVTVDIGLLNNGFGSTNNLVATLQESGGVTNPSGPQTYGSLAATSGSGTKSFSFVPNAPCGSNITLTLHLQDGTRDLGNVTFTMTMGVSGGSTTEFTQNFDGVTAPALPAGWTTARTGASPPALFVSTTTTADTAPNTVFTNGATSASTNSLMSPSIALPSGRSGFQLSFRQTRNFEGTTTTCYDGGILEISTDGGTNFTNVTNVAIGGSFSAGGYSGTINSSFSNPIGGQAGWCSSQASYGTSTLNLPGSLSGQNVIFRWRGGWDSSVSASNPNWRIDTVSLTSTGASCSGTPTTMTLVSSSNPAAFGEPVTFTATISPVPASGTVDFIVDGTPQFADSIMAAVPVDGSGQAAFTTSALSEGTHTVTARYNGTTTYGLSFSAIGGGGQVILAPTAAGVVVDGVVVTSDGRGIGNAVVRMTGTDGVSRTTRTNPFGRFRFTDVPVGDNYVLQPSVKGRRFPPTLVSVNDNVTGIVLVEQ